MIDLDHRYTTPRDEGSISLGDEARDHGPRVLFRGNCGANGYYCAASFRDREGFGGGATPRLALRSLAVSLREMAAKAEAIADGGPTEPVCVCDQEGDYCPAHPTCACGCQRHAHRGGACIAGRMTCHGCDGYRPAQLKRFAELTDDELEGPVTIDSLRAAYKILRAHHIEETTALWHKSITK